MVYIYNEILLSHQKEWNNAICSYMDGPRDRHTKWSKSEILRQMLHDNTYIWNLSSHCKHLLFFLLPLSFINSSPNYLLDVFISPHYHWILCSFKPPTFPPDLLYQWSPMGFPLFTCLNHVLFYPSDYQGNFYKSTTTSYHFFHL